MAPRRLRTLNLVAAVAAAAAITGASAVERAAAAEPLAWTPDVAAATKYAAGRRGTISFAARVNGRLYGRRTTRTVPGASVMKVMFMVAYLNHPSVRDRSLARRDTRLLRPMVTRSDNATATRIRDFVGNWRLRRLAKRAGMTRFRTAAIWGHCLIDAAAQARFLERVELFVPERHRERALELLESIVPSQRWGVGRVQPEGWRLYFKGGWGSGTGAVDHQVALLRRGEHRVGLAIMTTGNGSHSYGKETLRGVAKRLLRGLPAP